MDIIEQENLEQLRKAFNDLDSDELLDKVLKGTLSDSALDLAQFELDKRSNYSFEDLIPNSPSDTEPEIKSSAKATNTDKDNRSSYVYDDEIFPSESEILKQRFTLANKTSTGLFYSLIQLLPGLGSLFVFYLSIRSISNTSKTKLVLSFLIIISLISSLSTYAILNNSSSYYPLFVYCATLAIVSLKLGLKYLLGMTLGTGLVLTGYYFFVQEFFPTLF